jgi:hypothetical protein
MRRLRLAALAVVIAVAISANAQTFDLAVSGVHSQSCCITPITFFPIVFNGFEEWANVEAQTIAPGAAGNVYAAERGGSISIVRRGIPSRRFFTRQSPMTVHDLVVDRAGNVYVFAYANGSRLIAINANGTLRYDIPFDAVAAGGDLSADQCTLIYARHAAGAGRFDVCTMTPLEPIPGVAGGHTLRILPDGGFVVLENGLHRYDASGSLIRTIPRPPLVNVNVNALALGEHGRTALIADEEMDFTSRVFELDLDSGAVVRTVEVQLNSVTGIAAYRGWTAALGALAPAPVPSLSTSTLIAFAALLSVIALRRVV